MIARQVELRPSPTSDRPQPVGEPSRTGSALPMRRYYPPPGIDQQRLARFLEAVEAPCSVREQKLLRTVFENELSSADAKSLALVSEIDRIGLEPFHAPEPLPPIQPEDVHLVCWMALESV